MSQRCLLSIFCCLATAALSRADITTVSPWHTAGNGNYTDFGGGGWFQVPNVGLYHQAKAAFGAGPNTSLMVIHGVGFSDLQGISYTGQPVANLSIQPVPGWTGGVSFYGFDLGVWQTPPLERDVDYEIWNGDFSAKLASGTVTVGAVHTTVNVALFSLNGFNVQFESDGVVGFDNYRVEGSDSAAPKPYLSLSGNDVAIVNGDTTPALADHTDFGSGAGTRTFTITNSGPETLNLTGAAPDFVTLSGSADFSITSQPATPVAADGGNTTFAITFSPSAPGVKTATVNIASNDTSRNPFTFTVSGYTAGFSTGVSDSGFGNAGKVTSNFGGTANEFGRAVAVQPDGKILVAGSSNGAISQFALARYTNEGLLDSSFGTGGFVLLDVGPSTDECNAMALQPDGKILLAGYSWNGSRFTIVLVRFTSAGVLDTTFGTAGKVVTSVGSFDDFASAMTLQPDGKIVVVGSSSNGSNNDVSVVRFTETGALDTSFGSGGKVITGITNGSTDLGSAVALQADGKIVVGGSTFPGGGYNFLALRFTSAGTLDTGFGSGGFVSYSLRPGSDVVNSIALQQDGKILLGGYTEANPTDHDFGLVRLTDAGLLDADFGSSGIVITPLGANSDFGNALGLQADGKILLAGSTHDGMTSDFAMVRYTTTGALDPDFGNAGKVVTNLVSGQNDNANAIAVMPNGRIVLAGQAYSPVTNVDFAVAVYGAPAPDIAVAQVSPLSDTGNAAIGATIPGLAGTPVIFTITNPGSADLSSLAVTKTGEDAADFIVGNLSATSIPVGSGTATFTVTFSPTTAGSKSAMLQIASNVSGIRNPFDLTLSGNALSFALDSDSDGLNDASEFQMAAMGFNWQVGQPSLVNTYFNAAASTGHLTAAQMRAQHPGAPLIQRDADTGSFTLTLGIERSTTLLGGSFTDFPVTVPQTAVDDGRVLLTFPDSAPKAFYRIKAE